MIRPRTAVRCLVLALLLAACGGRDGRAAGGPPEIAVIPKGTTHEFWKSIHAGALRAEKEGLCRVAWKGPQREDDRAEQKKVVEDFISKKVAGIVLAPLDETALASVVKDAAAQGIPTVVIDSDLKGADYVSFVATDNFRGGQLAGERLGALLGGKGRAFMLRYAEGSASTTAREAGFLDVMKAKFPQIELVSTDQYGGATTESAMKRGENLLTKFPDVQGVFCPNESTTFGVLRALEDSGRAGKVFFVGFDSSEKLVAALRDGKLHGLVLQNPVAMGEKGVRTMLDHLAGRRVEKRIDTGAAVATKETMDQPEIRALLSPDLPPELR